MDRAAVEDLFHPFGAVTIKRMFGGLGFYSGGLMFAIEAGGEIYLKTDTENLPQFEARGLRSFSFETKRGMMVTSFRLLPEEAHEDQAELRRWCALALSAAKRAAAAKVKKNTAGQKLTRR